MASRGRAATTTALPTHAPGQERASTLVQPAVPKTEWVPDSTSPTCLNCNARFSLLRRRHHCRGCGALLCAACSSGRIVLSEARPSRACAACVAEVGLVRQRASSFSEAANLGIPYTLAIHGHPFKGIYLGEIEDDRRPHGMGRLAGDDGTWYTGEWLNGQFTGQGKLFLNNGKLLSYDGGWLNATFHGTGILYHADGTTIRYEGEWANDLRHGHGTAYDKEGKIEARGRWEQGNAVLTGAEYARMDL